MDGTASRGVDICRIMQVAKIDEPPQAPTKESRKKEKQPKNGSMVAVLQAERNANGDGVELSKGTDVQVREKAVATMALPKKYHCSRGNKNRKHKSAIPNKKKWSDNTKTNPHAEGGEADKSDEGASIHTKKPVLQQQKEMNGGAKSNAEQMLNGGGEQSTEKKKATVSVRNELMLHKRKKNKKKEQAEGGVDAFQPSYSTPHCHKKQNDNSHAKENLAQVKTGKGDNSLGEGHNAVLVHSNSVLHKHKKHESRNAKSDVARKKNMVKEKAFKNQVNQVFPSQQHTPVVTTNQNNIVSAKKNIAGSKQSKPVLLKKQNSNGSAKKLVDSSHGELPRHKKPAILEKKGHKGSKSHVSQEKSRKELEALDCSDVVVLKSHTQAVILKKNRDEGSEASSESLEIKLLKKRLFDAARDLDKERNTREMLENRVRSLGQELKLVKEKLGEDKQFCISTLHEELEFEQKLRISVQNDLSQSNETFKVAQAKIAALTRELELETEATRVVKGELQVAKDELETERLQQSTIKEQFDLERRKNMDLQRRLQYEAAASVAIRMELRALKGKVDEATKVAEELTKQRSASEGSQSAVKEVARPPLALHNKSDSEKDRLVRRLRKELNESKAELMHERQKQEPARQKHERQKQPMARHQKKCPQRSLSDWVRVAPTNSAQHAGGGLIPILQSPPSTSMPPPIETSLPGSRSIEMASPTLTETSPSPAANDSLFHFDDDDLSVAENAALEPLHDELTFLRSAYDPDEISVEDKKVTHFIELATWYDADTVSIAIALQIPDGYPAGGILGVKATIEGSRCSHALRKCAENALPLLEEILKLEARANEGRETMHSIFSVASGWAHSDWYKLLSKELSVKDDAKQDPKKDLFEVCTALIHTHHIRDTEKMQIQTIKKNASKLSLGGFLKIGKPGLILIEGDNTDCDQFVEALAQSKKVFHTSTFKVGGRALRKVSDTDDRRLPRKMGQLENKGGMDELSSLCKELGLLQALQEIIS